MSLFVADNIFVVIIHSFFTLSNKVICRQNNKQYSTGIKDQEIIYNVNVS